MLTSIRNLLNDLKQKKLFSSTLFMQILIKHPVNTSLLRKMRHEKDCFTNHIIRKLMNYYMADSKIGSSSIELVTFSMDIPPQTWTKQGFRVKNELHGYNVQFIPNLYFRHFKPKCMLALESHIISYHTKGMQNLKHLC